MAKNTKAVQGSKAVVLDVQPLGRTVFMRSAVWNNGKRIVAAIVTGVDDASEVELNGAEFIVSVTAFPPGMPSRIMQQVPLFLRQPADDNLLCAWMSAT